MYKTTVYHVAQLKNCFNEMISALSIEAQEDRQYIVRLALYELVTNVLVHSKCKAEIQAEQSGGTLTVQVKGKCEFCPENSIKSKVTDEGGRGMEILHCLCNEYYYEDHGKTAVCKIRL